MKLPDGTVKVLVEGEKRVKILKYNENDGEKFLKCSEGRDTNISKDLELLALSLIKNMKNYQF